MQNIPKEFSVQASVDLLGEAVSRSGGVDEIPAIKRVVEGNKLSLSPVELQTVLTADPKLLYETPELIDLTNKLLRSTSGFSSVRGRALDLHEMKLVRGWDPSISSLSYPPCRSIPHLCKVRAFKGSDVRQGTGFRIASDLVLTCRHVLPDDMDECTLVEFHFPAYNQDIPFYGGKKVKFNARQIAHAVKDVTGKPKLLAESPPFLAEKKNKKSPWSLSESDFAGQQFLDYALLELDESRNEWSANVVGTRESFTNLNIWNQLQSKLAEGIPLLAPPPFQHTLAELMSDVQKATILRVDGDYQLAQKSTVTFHQALEWAHRIRYKAAETEKGDSGAPLAVACPDNEGHETWRVVALHNGEFEEYGQAIPLPIIIQSILQQSKDLQPLIQSWSHVGDLQGST